MRLAWASPLSDFTDLWVWPDGTRAVDGYADGAFSWLARASPQLLAEAADPAAGAMASLLGELRIGNV